MSCDFKTIGLGFRPQYSGLGCRGPDLGFGGDMGDLGSIVGNAISLTLPDSPHD